MNKDSMPSITKSSNNFHSNRPLSAPISPHQVHMDDIEIQNIPEYRTSNANTIYVPKSTPTNESDYYLNAVKFTDEQTENIINKYKDFFNYKPVMEKFLESHKKKSYTELTPNEVACARKIMYDMLGDLKYLDKNNYKNYIHTLFVNFYLVLSIRIQLNEKYSNQKDKLGNLLQDMILYVLFIFDIFEYRYLKSLNDNKDDNKPPKEPSFDMSLPNSVTRKKPPLDPSVSNSITSLQDVLIMIQSRFFREIRGSFTRYGFTDTFLNYFLTEISKSNLQLLT